MYYITDKVSAIKALQRLLFIEESGFYDDRTRQNVIEHQKANNLPQTGDVDYFTFISIRDKHFQRNILENTRRDVPFESRFPYSFGMYGDDVGLINSILSINAQKYSPDTKKPSGSYYSKDTEQAVSELRHIFMLEDGITVDELFYDRLNKSIK